MKKSWMLGLLVLAVCGVIAIFQLRTASAHCDTMDGPVVQAAQRALESGNINEVLPWVPEESESEVQAAFTHVRLVRALSPEAKALADRYFFETLVRVHRAGEGEPYTGLKPAGTEISPAVKAADASLETDSADEVIELLTQAMQEGIAARYQEAKETQGASLDDVAARREGVHAYVVYVHYVEGVYAAATGEAEGHAEAVAHAAEPAH